MSVTIQIPRKFNIPQFHCDHTVVEGKPVPEQHLAPLEECAADRSPEKGTSENAVRHQTPLQRPAPPPLLYWKERQALSGEAHAKELFKTLDISSRLVSRLGTGPYFPYSNLKSVAVTFSI